jgi:dienelactone hydrolase
MLSFYQYGHMPPKPDDASVETLREEDVLDGRGVCRWLRFTIANARGSASMRANVVTPCGDGPWPVVVKNAGEQLLEGFKGKPAAESPDVQILPEVLQRGFAMCKFVRTDLARDAAGARSEGVFPLYPEYDWGAIGVWSWAYQLVIDALERMPNIDAGRVVATGHSRGGKTALCASIYDERIAIAAPNSSGTGGTGSLRLFEDGREPFQRIARHIGTHDHWWGPRFMQFAHHEERLPFDGHTARALIAPRPQTNPHALADYWANPYGSELTHRAARMVYDWLGAGASIAMHWREGGHAQGIEDWRALLDFTDLHFRGRSPTCDFTRMAYPDARLPVTWEP